MPRITFPNAIAGLSGNIAVRFGFFGGSNGSNGTFRMDDFVLNGFTTAVENWSPAEYRYGFNNKEKDDEVKGSGNSYDFGARMYDSRVGRFLSIDPKKTTFPEYSHFSFAINSPLFLIDNAGEDPKVAILFYSETDNGAPYFNQHIASLNKAGYTIIIAKTGQEVLDIMGQYSCPESPIEELIIISHGHPGGLEMSHDGGGIWTESELNNRAKDNWQEERYLELKEKYPNKYEILLRVQAQEEANELFNSNEPDLVQQKESILNDFKREKSIATISDIKEGIDNGNISIIESTKVVLAGCNIAGKVDPDGQEIFAKSLCEAIQVVVFASKGYTGQINGTGVRRSSSSPTYFDGKGKWIEFNPNGDQKNLGNTIDLCNP